MTEITIDALATVPDRALLCGLATLVRQSRRAEADLVAHVSEVDARLLYAGEGCSSMFAYSTEVLGLSEAEAYLRITAGRTARQYPIVLEMLRDGRLNLGTIRRLAPHLTNENHAAVLARAAARARHELERLVAELAPKPDAPATIRKLPLRLRPFGLFPGGVAPAVDAGPTPAGAAATPPGVRAAGATAAQSPGGAVVLDPCAEVVAPQPHRFAIEATAPDRYRVQFSIDSALRARLERLRDLMRTTVPDGDLARIIGAAVTEKLQRLEAQRLGRTQRPRTTPADDSAPSASRHIPAAVRRTVCERDDDRCRFVSAAGRRCTARAQLEFHHRHPYGYGGDRSVGNIVLMCRAHNRYIAEMDYGRLQPVAVGRRDARGASASAIGTTATRMRAGEPGPG